MTISELKHTILEQIIKHLDTASLHELGEAIDMVKDLAEAEYYCTITDAMHSQDEATVTFNDPRN